MPRQQRQQSAGTGQAADGQQHQHRHDADADPSSSSASSTRVADASPTLASAAAAAAFVGSASPATTSSSSSSSYLSAGTLLLILILSIMSASAFRNPNRGGGGTHARSSRSTHSVRATKRAIMKSASKIHSFGYKAAERAAEAVERHKRTYWDELVPPFGLDGGTEGLELDDFINTSHSLGSTSYSTSKSSGRGKKKKRRKKGALYRSLKMKLAKVTKKTREEAAAAIDAASGFDGEGRPLAAAGTGANLHLDDISQGSGSDEEWDVIDDDEGGVEKSVTHFCFLVHGHRGLSRDLWYLESVLNDAAARRRREEMDAAEELVGNGTIAGLTRSATGASYGSMEDLGAGAGDIGSEGKTEEEGEPRLVGGSRRRVRHDVLVHNVVCNEGRTHDGVVAGGERVAEEMLGVIRDEVERRRRRKRRLRKRRGKDGEGARKDGDDDEDDDEIMDVTISMVGNSLGGLYSRYAVAHIANMSQPGPPSAFSTQPEDEEEDEGAILVDDGHGGLIRLHYNSFYTTASPHLGTSRHTYLPLPLPLEIPIAKVLGDTGRDLFRLTPLLREMATSEAYLGPLSKFKTRVAYANAYHTDFPVPASTAAFLSEGSDYPHHFADDENDTEDDMNDVAFDAEGRIIATLHVPPVSSARRSKSEGDEPATIGSSSTQTQKKKKEEEEARHRDELALMSSSLDSLGWKKVIVDLRSDMPLSLSVPDVSTVASSMIRKGSEILSRRKLLRSEEEEEQEQEQDEDREDERQPVRRSPAAVSEDGGPCPAVATGCPRTIRRARSSLSSREVATAFSSSRGSVHLPLGHNMIVAFSRTRFSSLVNRGGRPVMDRLARELVEDMVSWSDEKKNEEERTAAPEKEERVV